VQYVSQYTIVCDVPHCGVSLVVLTTSKHEARRAARAAGWELNRLKNGGTALGPAGGRDYCPHHFMAEDH